MTTQGRTRWVHRFSEFKMVFSGPAQGLLCDPALTGLG